MGKLPLFALLSAVIAWPPLVRAADVAACDATCSVCSIPQNVVLQLPAACLLSGGDVIIQGANPSNATYLFRAFNNLVDTGGGTGLSRSVILYGSNDNTPLPDPSTYSLNSVTIQASASGPTFYFGPGSGTSYYLDTATVPTKLVLSAAHAADDHDPAQFTAVLTAVPTGTAIVNANVQFTLGSQSCSARTNTSGVATCGVTLDQAPGRYTAAASFDGIFGTDAATKVTMPFIITPERCRDKDLGQHQQRCNR
jgi:hypothetical protein